MSAKPVQGAIPHRLSAREVVELADRHGVWFYPGRGVADVPSRSKYHLGNADWAKFGLAKSITQVLANESMSRDEARDFLHDVFANWPTYWRHMALWMTLTPPPERLTLNFVRRFMLDLLDLYRRGADYLATEGTDANGERWIDADAALWLSRAFRPAPEAAELVRGMDPYRKGLVVLPNLAVPSPLPAGWS